jgi:pyridoxine 5-phosphate synthase
MPIALSVNLNKIALLRNSRSGNYPDPLAFGRIALAEGAQGLTLHPRPDQRHVRPRDVFECRDLLTGYNAASSHNPELNIEGNPFAQAQGDYPGLLALVEATRPEQCTLVPDTHSQLTSDHGFNLTQDGERLKPILAQLKSWGVRVSLFMDPDIEQIRLAAQLGADRIELYTGPFAEAHLHQAANLPSLIEHYRTASAEAKTLGLGVNAGHDLNLANLSSLYCLPRLQEVSIGHALTVDALQMGFAAAVRAYVVLCEGYSGKND